MNSQRIFDVRVDNLKRKEIDSLLARVLKNGSKQFNLPLSISTLNPEILLKARENSNFRDCLNGFDLNIVDGFGVVVCSALSLRKVYRYPGADLAKTILKKSLKSKIRVTFILSADGLSSKEDLLSFLRRSFGKKKADLCDVVTENEIAKKGFGLLKKSQVAFVGLGAPKQELLVCDLKQKRNNLKIAIGVGGTFDYWTKKQARPPKIFVYFGLEWFWRLMTIFKYSRKKQRLRRIFNAVFMFPVVYFKHLVANFKVKK